MHIQPFGDKALLVSFEKKIDPEINQQVINLYHTLKASAKFTFLTPAYCSLTVGIDRSRFTINEATELIKELASQPLPINRFMLENLQFLFAMKVILHQTCMRFLKSQGSTRKKS